MWISVYCVSNFFTEQINQNVELVVLVEWINSTISTNYLSYCIL